MTIATAAPIPPGLGIPTTAVLLHIRSVAQSHPGEETFDYPIREVSEVLSISARTISKSLRTLADMGQITLSIGQGRTVTRVGIPDREPDAQA